MAKKRIKKVFLLGRIFDLDLDDPGNFEQSVCSELKLLLKGQDIPFKAVVNDSTLTMKLPLTIDDVNDPNVFYNPEDGTIPLELEHLIESPNETLRVLYGSLFSWSIMLEDFIHDYKKRAREKKASRPKGIDARFSKVKGLTMTINY